jgi:ubiquitin carboxyl-terminal hydrolase 36/42
LIKSYRLRSTNLFPLLCVQSGKFGKISKAIRFPETLNLSSYMSTRDDNSPVYSLYGVVVHHDVMNAAFSGHYVCYVKDTHGKWYKTDDSQVY